jgi:hypothetical protein
MKRERVLSKDWRFPFLVAMSFGFLLLTFLLPLSPDGYTEELKVVILHTNNVTGHLFACPT